MPINAMTPTTSPLDGLLAALRLSLPLGGDAHADARLLAEVADFDSLAALATRHQVRGLLLRGGEQAALESQSGPLVALAAKLREGSAGRSGTVRRAMGQLFELRRLAAILNAHETPFLVLKGRPWRSVCTATHSFARRWTSTSSSRRSPSRSRVGRCWPRAFARPSPSPYCCS